MGWLRRAATLSSRGWGTLVLAGWLIATGLVPLLGLGSSTVAQALNLTAIAAGVLLLVEK